MVAILKKGHFSGAGKVFEGGDDGLTAMLRGVMQYQTAVGMGTGLSALTDNSGGNASNATANIGQVSYGVLSGTNMSQKAELETALGLVKDALTEIGAKLIAAYAAVPGTPLGTITNSIGGAAADGTIAALDVSMTGVNASIASAAGLNTILTNVTKLMKQETYLLNKVCNAVGVTPLVDDLGEGVVPAYTNTLAALAVDTGTAVSGADATAANGGALKTEVDAALVKIANYVAKLAAKCNAVQAFCDAPTLRVIAG
jgi:hypothetical protein